ncbi:3-oxoacyl-ACP reductase [Alkalihalobacillus sp. TS-13]|uniref:3-oxoacyl-ACP reductase n=1 Tax=Alkalihalobacillus sp. TS-13 TaxID=2842455 RepID=UPI001C873870|nr:3-oxoacyl-ACP reductase [Alkalihalobacillus sp. TS-13]
MADLNNRVAIVTGGAKGIGEAISREFARNGVKVVINYNSSKGPAEELIAELKEVGGEAYAVQADVSNLDESKKLVEETIDHFGTLDFVVNNAGITRDSTFKKLSEEDWRTVIDVNLNSIYNTTSAALPYLFKSDAGRIINISSIIGQAGGFGQTNYAAAKSGMIGYTKSLALELAKSGITVNSVCPGFIDTDMIREIPENIREQIVAKIPKRRFGKPEEIARGVIFLCKDSGYITGQQLNINGGLYM